MRTATRFPLERIAAMDRAVRAGKYPNAGTIARELEVCRRTVQRDIEFMKCRLGAPLVFVAEHQGYIYSDPDYRLPVMAMTEGELVALLMAERALQLYRGTPYAVDLARAFRKVTAGLSERVTVDLAHLSDGHSFRISAAAGLDPLLFRDIDSAIRGHRRLAIRYDSASRGQEMVREVDPYHLASIDGQWYLVGHCHLRGEVRMFAPARVRSLEVMEATFQPPPDFRIDDYLSGALSVLRGAEGESHRVRLRFTGEATRYIREQTRHSSQTIDEMPDGSLILGLTVGHLREVERLALSWGASCEVLEPSALRARVSRELIAAARLYDAPDR